MKEKIRAANEVKHGELLASRGPEELWGWGSPAGQLRATRRARLILEGACVGSESLVCEIGCGVGNFTERFAKSGAALVAVDISPDLIDLARRRGLPGDRVTFLQKRVEDLDLDRSFDAIIGSSVLHHLNMSEALPRIAELLKPGGWFSFAEPNMLNPQVFAERHFRFLFPRVSPDETAFVRFSLGRDLEACGFSEVSIVPFDWLHPSTPRCLIGMVSSLGSLVERVPLVREFSGSLLIRARKPTDSKYARHQE